MSDLESKLTAALNADAPPARDAKFRIEVLVRIERARFKRRLILAVSVAFAAAAMVGLNAQVIAAWITTDIWRLGIVAAATIAATFSLSGVPLEALPGFRRLARTLRRWQYP